MIDVTKCYLVYHCLVKKLGLTGHSIHWAAAKQWEMEWRVLYFWKQNKLSLWFSISTDWKYLVWTLCNAVNLCWSHFFVINLFSLYVLSWGTHCFYSSLPAIWKHHIVSNLTQLTELTIFLSVLHCNLSALLWCKNCVWDIVLFLM